MLTLAFQVAQLTSSTLAESVKPAATVTTVPALFSVKSAFQDFLCLMEFAMEPVLLLLYRI